MDASPVEARRRDIAVPGGTVAAYECGAAGGPLGVLFLHANGFNAATYHAVLAPLGAGLRVLAADLRGHGATHLPTLAENHSWRVFAEDLLALLQALGETPRILAGHSMGGTTALLALPRLPAPLPRLVLFDPVLAPRTAYTGVPEPDAPIARGAARRKPDFASADEAFAAYRGRGAFATWPDETLRDYLRGGLGPGPDSRVLLTCTPAWEAANFAAFCVADPYPALDAPITDIDILRAETASTCFYAPPKDAPRIRLRVIPGTTHFLPMERPDVIREALTQP